MPWPRYKDTKEGRPREFMPGSWSRE